jgi:NAD(P)H-dependent flavin oxidoreductase YrpB (nitropropane dioxygenase family)
MLRTPICDLFAITHPVVLGGMGLGTNPDLVAAVSNAGGLGIQGCGARSPDDIRDLSAGIRACTDRPFGLNLLLFRMSDDQLAATLDCRPPVLSTAWARGDQDLAAVFARAHDAGAKVLHMVSTVPEAMRAVAAGADAIVAQGTEGGGHVGLMGTIVLVPLVARAVAPVPVLAAGGLADGTGLAAALMLGAAGALYGTRFLATPEASVPDAYKHALVRSDGHHTVLTELPDVANATVWPGAYARVERNRWYETWAGREGDLRYQPAEVAAAAWRAFERGNTDETFVYTGQSAGLIDAVEPAGSLVERIVADALECLRRSSLFDA